MNAVRIETKAFAKLNLFLDITGRLPNGYHTINSVMQSVSLADDITVSVEEADENSIVINASNPLIQIPANDKNIAWRAAELFLKKLNKKAAVEIDIEKRIPVEAGLGGSSTDGAAVLSALNKIFDSPYTLKELEELGKILGADVPFCISGGTAKCTGIGDDMDELPFIGDCAFLIVKPDFSCSTKEAYAYYDEFPVPMNKDFNGFTAAVKDGCFLNTAGKMYNVFENLYKNQPFYSRLCALKKELLESNSCGAVMTGSGSAVFGVFKSEREARDAYNALPYPKASKHIALPLKRG